MIIATLLILGNVDLVGVVTYDKFMLRLVDRRLSGSRRCGEITGIARCGRRRGRTGRKAIGAVRVAVAICLWCVATCA